MPKGAQAAPHPVRPRLIISSTPGSSSSSSHYNNYSLILVSYVVVVVFSSFWFTTSVAQEEINNNNNVNEGRALLNFKSSLQNAESTLSNWNPSIPPCSGNHANWYGVICTNGYVWGLQLENINLKGKIETSTLVPLRSLRTLSFMGNEFDGNMPDWRKLGALKSLYLSYNQFSGQIPEDAFKGMTSLKKVHMSHNKLTGHIPASLESPKLIELRLEHNHFTGTIPPISSEHLKIFNVSDNQLDGPIPKNLLKMDPSSFTGNKALCGKPLETSCAKLAPTPAPTPAMEAPAADEGDDGHELPAVDQNKSSLSSGAKIAIIVSSVVVGLIIIAMVVVLYMRKRCISQQTPQLGREVEVSENHVQAAAPQVAAADQISSSTVPAVAATATTKSTTTKSEQPGKLSFVREDRERFDLQDLMRASAEVLGSGNFGASYKAVLVDGEALVVKRFKQMNSIAREDFHEHMRRLGRLKHPNLLPLVAYLYRKEEKLLVFDYVQNGSLATHLHGNHSAEQPGLSWATRLKIIKGVAKGLVYLRNELPSLTIPHGHLKSSNVLLDKEFTPLLMDYALNPVVKSSQVHQVLVAYKSPEYTLTGQVSKKTDVWCLGILILETLTGKYVAQGSGTEVLGWINAIAGEEIANVFDPEMENISYQNKTEMEKLLRIGVYCCQEDQETRWNLDEAVQQIQLVQEDSDSDSSPPTDQIN